MKRYRVLFALAALAAAACSGDATGPEIPATAPNANVVAAPDGTTTTQPTVQEEAILGSAGG